MGKLPKANKDLGQHFLKDKTVIQKIMDDAPEDFDAIVEVGPGPGVLTTPLNDFERPLYLIEMDARFEEMLQLSNVEEIFFQDAMQFEWDKFLQDKDLKGKKIWLVSNLPYNVSSQLFAGFCRVPEITAMTLMYQKEVGEKTVLREGVKNQMNSLLMLSSAFFDAKSITKVSPGAFLPPPKVDSIVVGYKRKEPLVPLSNFKTYEAFLRKLFSFKRKQIGSVLRSWPEGKELAQKLEENGFDLRTRAEALSQDQVMDLYLWYCA